MGKNELLKEIGDTLAHTVVESGLKVDDLSRHSSIEIMISIDEPKDIPWREFRQKVIEPALKKFKDNGWTATTTTLPGSGLYIKLS